MFVGVLEVHFSETKNNERAEGQFLHAALWRGGTERETLNKCTVFGTTLAQFEIRI